ncbi:MAG: glyoxylase-like metal-dependent hydrolase (beta-lactamase superfamily II) [Candidatus Poriferisodalaceae bacterium]|jgi:glyoxylase-like metal-dependent hydrolase (beta-lactamase superfamily II)
MATGWSIGETSVVKVVEGDLLVKGHHVLPAATPDALAEIDWLQPNYLTNDGRFNLSIHALVVDTPTATILVDTCVGNDKERTSTGWNMLDGSFLEDLTQAGFDRLSIDYVVCTHLHLDHVGWNTMLVDGTWVPTFPNARYLFARSEWESWTDEVARSADVKHTPIPGLDVELVMADSLTPVLEAGLVDLVDVDHRINDEVWFEPTPGHTAGHVSVRISSGGEDAVITGDMTHHPCQIARPDWHCYVDHNPAQSSQTRRDFYARYADEPVLVIGTHFAEPTAGHIVTTNDGYRLE